MIRLRPLFMWAGGKTKMIPKYEDLPGLPSGRFVYEEPFLGGGAMFCHLWNQNKIEHAYLNDLNKELIDLYREIQSPSVERFIEILKEIEAQYFSQMDRKKFYYGVRDAYAFGYLEDDPMLESATLFFLLKTCFNGIFQTIEGSDKFASPCGLLNHGDILFDYPLIRAWNHALKDVTLTHGSWDSTRLQDGSFVFADPPYRDSFKHYGVDSFDHEYLIKRLGARRGLTWLCNRLTDDDFYETNAHDWELYVYPVTYTAGRRKQTDDGFAAVKAHEVLLVKGKLDEV